MAGRVELSIVAKNQASAALKQVGKDIRGLSTEAGKSKSAFADMFSVAGGNLLARGIQSATSAMVGLGKAAIGVVSDMVTASANMNAQVSGIGAVLGLTTEELGKVKGLINELGVNPNLKVNAQEAANAIDMLARNGLTLDQILNGAAEATVFLANATGGTFDTSANVATDAMAMFKIKAEDMMTAVDGITSVTVASKFGLNDYQLALSQAGGVASALGVDFGDFNATIAATSSSFASGSDAGTSYKTFLQRLVPQSDEASAAMAELGLYSFNTEKAMAELQKAGIKPLSTDMNTLIGQLMNTYAATRNVNLGTDEGLAKFNEWAKEAGFVQNSFYDANGQLKDMASISSILSQATSSLTEEQKNQYLTTIFGSDAMRTAFGLAEKGQVVYTDVAKAAQELGVSQEDLAKYAADGITAFEALQATMEKTDALKGAQMRVDNLAGDMEIFSGIVDSVKMQLGDQFQPILRAVFQEMTKALTAVTPQILAFGNVVGQQVSGAVTRLMNAFKAFQSGGGIKDIGKALGLSPKFISVITAVVKNIDLLKGAFKGMGTALAIGATIAGVAAAIGALTNPITRVMGAAALLGAAWERNMGGIQEKTQAVINFVRPGFEQLFSWITAAAGGDFSGLAAGLNGALQTVNATIEAFSWNDFVTELGDWGTYITDLLWPSFVTAVELGSYVADLAWDAFVTGTVALTDYIVSLDWAGFITDTITVASYITNLAWDTFITGTIAIGSYIASLDWASFISGAISIASYITALSWDTFVTGAISVASYITSLDWSSFITDTIAISSYVTNLAWDTFVTGTIAIGSYIASLDWATFVTDTIAVSSYITALSWSAFIAGSLTITSYITALDWSAFITDTISIASYVTALTWDSFISGAIVVSSYITSLDWAAFITSTVDMASMVTSVQWSDYISPLLWGTVIPTLSDWGTYITSLNWTSIITTALDWATWIPALSWAGFITSLEWSVYIAAFAWTSFVSVLNWATVAGDGIDWATFVSALSWENIVAALDWAAYITAFTWDSFVSKLEWTGTVAKLDNWASYVPTLTWSSFVTALSNWGTYIAALDWTSIITATIDWATWLTVLPWNTFVKALEWTAFVGNIAWTGYISKLDWSVTATTLNWYAFITPLSEWSNYIISLPWGTYVAALSNWGAFVASLAWSSFVANIDWPSFIPSFDWSAFITGIDLTSWIPTFPGWAAIFGGGNNGGYAGPYAPGAAPSAMNTPNRTNPFANPGGNADGTNHWEGGWTWVGERGPELLNLPKGSQILSNTESKKMIGQLADGTTTATAAQGSAPRQGNVFAAIANAASNFGQAGTGIKKAAETMSKASKDLEAGLRKVPGLFGTSQVTDQQMKMAELGIPQSFADDWIRRLTDEVVNGVDWEGVDIKDAAMRAGLDPALPAEAILEMVTQKWNDKSLFADPKNLELINQEAVKAALAQQAAQAVGEKNMLGLFGITPEQAGAAGVATGSSAGTGMLTGITQTLTNSGTGQQIATAVSTGVTPESMAPVGATMVSGLTTELQKDEYSAQIGTALGALFTGYLDKADAFADVAQQILARITSQFGNVTGLDIVAKFTDAFRTQLSSDDAIASLARVGEKILELVFRGYLDEARKRNWAEGVNAKGDTTSTGATTATTSVKNAIGTGNWRGGMAWVGETGPELVSLPARSRIFSNSESMALAGAGGGNVVVNNYFTINNDVDYERAAYRIADIIRRRR